MQKNCAIENLLSAMASVKPSGHRPGLQLLESSWPGRKVPGTPGRFSVVSAETLLLEPLGSHLTGAVAGLCLPSAQTLVLVEMMALASQEPLVL